MDREGLGNYHTYSGQLAKDLPRIGAHKGNLKEHLRARDAFVAFLTERLTEAHRTLRPGGFALVWAYPKTSHWTAWALEEAGFEVRDVITHLFPTGMLRGTARKDVPDELWGWDTTLAPGAEHWLLARKPPIGPLKTNYETWGTGGINVEASRAPDGKLPKNTLVTHAADCDGVCSAACPVSVLGLWRDHDAFPQLRAVGLPKTSKDERFAYCPTCLQVSPNCDHDLVVHPTPKSQALMEWLVRLVCPPGGSVLDPFMGTGATGVAAFSLGCQFVGVELDPHYMIIARHRLDGAPKVGPPDTRSLFDMAMDGDF